EIRTPDPQIRSLDPPVDPTIFSCKPGTKRPLTLQRVKSSSANQSYLIEVGPSTPIAAELQAHFAAGGTMADGVRLVELLERGAQMRARKKVAARGTRLPADWEISQECINYALDRGMTRDRVAIEAEKFRNYWTSKSGADATKVDWFATWRNWVLIAMEKRNG